MFYHATYVITEKITQQALLALVEKGKKNLDEKDYVNQNIINLKKAHHVLTHIKPCILQ